MDFSLSQAQFSSLGPVDLHECQRLVNPHNYEYEQHNLCTYEQSTYSHLYTESHHNCPSIHKQLS